MTTKKNWMVRAIVLMLALVLITSCFVGGTFAKYVTSGSGTDTARVAKFGVTVGVKNETMFKTEYTTDDGDAEAEIEYSVVTDPTPNGDKKKLVAPGTKEDKMAEVTIEGTPEVAVRVNYEVTDMKLEHWFTDKTEEDAYCPLVFTVNDEQYYVGKDGIADTAALIKAVQDAVSGYSKEYAAGTNLSEKSGENLVIGWSWNFDEAKKPEGSIQTDVKDTALGDRAADVADTAATISMTLKATVTQID